MTWLYGKHAVLNALDNSSRSHRKILLAKSYKDKDEITSNYQHLKIELVTPETLTNRFGDFSVHQGIALETSELQQPDLEDILEQTADKDNSVILILDQVTDPHNVGAITRTAAAFNADAIIMPRHHSAPIESAILAKTACGGVEHINLVQVTNLARSMDLLKENNYWCIGLDERGEQTIAQANLSGKTALVLGAEGKGLRRLTKEKCDLLVKLPTSPNFPTLNVSNAAALALYEFNRQNTKK